MRPTNDGTDRSQLSHVANETKVALGVEKLDAVADRSYFNSEEIRACEEGWHHGYAAAKADDLERKAEGRFGKQDFRAMWLLRTFTFVLPARSSPTTTRPRKADVGCCAATGPTSARAVQSSSTCTTGKANERITRWEHEHILEAVFQRRPRRASGEDAPAPRDGLNIRFGTIKARMGATHFAE